MAEQQKPANGGGNGDILLIAGGAAALYFFWPQISAMFGTSTAAAPVTVTPATGTTTSYVNGQPDTYTGPPQQQFDPGFTVVPQSGGPMPVITTLPLLPAPATPPARPTIPTLARLQPVLGNRNLTPAAPTSGFPFPPLKGIRLQGGSAALIAQAALNNMLSEDAPQLTNSRPINQSAPGATMTPEGCWRYGDTPVLLNCPPGVPPPPPRPAANGHCMPGYTMSASGICAKGFDQVALALLNSTVYSGTSGMPAQLPSPSIVGVYVSTVGVNPGSWLGQLLGLPANPTNGVIEHGNDGFAYQPINGVYMRQGTATQLTRPTGPIGPRLNPLPRGAKLNGLGWVANTLPVTTATLIAASNDPTIAAMLGTDPRAMLTMAQWNYYYTQASGVLQVAPPYPAVDPHALISATQYQAWRRAAGLGSGKLGMLRPSRPGAFPLGSIRPGPDRQPFIQKGNNTIFRIPGRGAIRMGMLRPGGGDHRWSRSPFPRAAGWREAE